MKEFFLYSQFDNDSITGINICFQNIENKQTCELEQIFEEEINKLSCLNKNYEDKILENINSVIIEVEKRINIHIEQVYTYSNEKMEFILNDILTREIDLFLKI